MKTTRLTQATAIALAMLAAGQAAATPAAASAPKKPAAERKASPAAAKKDAAPAAAAPAAAAQAKPSGAFARVGDSVIGWDEYNAAMLAAMRAKYYHGKPPEKEIAQLQREVADQVVERVLLLREANERGLKADSAEIQKTIKAYDERYASSEQWVKNRDKMIPSLTMKLEQDSLLQQLEKTVRGVARPEEKDVRAYYEANAAKFTEPEQIRVGVILLKVPPTSASAAWVKAFDDATEILKALKGGADFATLAKEKSQDDSAKNGGDLGYLHKGMLPEGLEDVLARMKVGELSEPTQVLEGIAVLRVIDRKEAKLNPFERVKGRAADLLQRDRSDRTWKDMVAGLKKKTPPQIDQSQFLPLAEKPDASATGSHAMLPGQPAQKK